MDLTALRASARRKIGINITSTEYSDTNLDANINEWYRLAVVWVMNASGVWEPRGEMSTTNLVADQNEYVLPLDMIFINRVEVKYDGATNYVKADRIDDKETESAFQNGEIDQGSTVDPVYRLYDNSLFLYPAPDANATDGLAIEYSKDVTDLATGTDTPDLNPLLERIIATGAAKDYCLSEEMEKKARELEYEIYGRPGASPENSLKRQIEELAHKRDRSVKIRINPRRTNYK